MISHNKPCWLGVFRLKSCVHRALNTICPANLGCAVYPASRSAWKCWLNTGGVNHPRLNMKAWWPIENKYRKGKLKQHLFKELKEHEIRLTGTGNTRFIWPLYAARLTLRRWLQCAIGVTTVLGLTSARVSCPYGLKRGHLRSVVRVTAIVVHWRCWGRPILMCPLVLRPNFGLVALNIEIPARLE